MVKSCCSTLLIIDMVSNTIIQTLTYFLRSLSYYRLVVNHGGTPSEGDSKLFLPPSLRVARALPSSLPRFLGEDDRGGHKTATAQSHLLRETGKFDLDLPHISPVLVQFLLVHLRVSFHHSKLGEFIAIWLREATKGQCLIAFEATLLDVQSW